MNVGDAQVSVYKNVKDADSLVTSTVDIILGHIYGGRWEKAIMAIRSEKDKKKRNEMKRYLPGVTFSGTFSHRYDENLIDYSGLLIIDFDTTNLQKANRIKKKLSKSRFVYAAFFSPSMGVKALVKTENLPEHHRDCVFPKLKMHLEGHVGQNIDTSGKNLSRLCFVSMDDDMYYNPDSSSFNVDVQQFLRDQERRKRRQEQKYKIDASKLSNNVNFILDKCVLWTCNREVYKKTNRNNFVHLLSCHMNRAGVQVDMCSGIIFSRYSSLGFEEVRSTVEGVYRRNNGEFGSKPIYDNRKEKDLF